MIAHLSRLRMDRTGEYREAPLHFAADEWSEPTCYAIDIGRSFVIDAEGNLYLTGEGKARFQTFTPEGLLRSARDGWFGFTLLWDQEAEIEEGVIDG